MKTFMLGWEFPPHISGGLGTACYGITKALTNLGVDVVFVLPRAVTSEIVEERMTTVASLAAEPAPPNGHGPRREPLPALPCGASAPGATADVVATTQGTLAFRLTEMERLTFRTVDAMLSPYMTVAQYQEQLCIRQREIRQSAVELRRAGVPAVSGAHDASAATAARPGSSAARALTTTIQRRVVRGGSGQYAGDMLLESQRYAALASVVARGEQFDVVHAHDWMTFSAGIAVAAARRKPLIVHVHSTEIDRAGTQVNQRIFEIEKHGMEVASGVIAVSDFTRDLIVKHYGIAPGKISVVHNGIEPRVQSLPPVPQQWHVGPEDKVVLFLGRLTAQKGPEHFLAAARKVVDVYPAVKFVMAGSGDLMAQTIEQAARLGLGDKVLFTGFLQGPDVERIFAMADLYVMPSVSEPFGIAPLEAMSRDVPVIISKQSGVAEVIDHALKVDFWDSADLADKMVAVLRHPPLAATLRQRGMVEVAQLTWADAARKICDVYGTVLHRNSGRQGHAMAHSPARHGPHQRTAAPASVVEAAPVQAAPMVAGAPRRDDPSPARVAAEVAGSAVPPAPAVHAAVRPAPAAVESPPAMGPEAARLVAPAPHVHPVTDAVRTPGVPDPQRGARVPAKVRKPVAEKRPAPRPKPAARVALLEKPSAIQEVISPLRVPKARAATGKNSPPMAGKAVDSKAAPAQPTPVVTAGAKAAPRAPAVAAARRVAKKSVAKKPVAKKPVTGKAAPSKPAVRKPGAKKRNSAKKVSGVPPLHVPRKRKKA